MSHQDAHSYIEGESPMDLRNQIEWLTQKNSRLEEKNELLSAQNKQLEAQYEKLLFTNQRLNHDVSTLRDKPATDM